MNLIIFLFAVDKKLTFIPESLKIKKMRHFSRNFFLEKVNLLKKEICSFITESQHCRYKIYYL